MGDKPAIGGTGKFGKALKDGLRGPVRTSEEDAKRLLDGSAWSEFCRSLDLAGRHLLAYPTKSTPVPGEVESEGVRYGLGLVTAGILQALQLSDPATPRIVRNPDSESKWGAENVDNQYLWARISPAYQYRVFGNRNNIFEALLETKDGYMQIGDDRVFETLFLTEMECEKDGSFEVLLAAERPAGHRGNFMKMPPGTQYFCVRQYFVDWEKEWPARFEIERIGGLGVRPAPYTAAKTAQLLDEAGLWVLQSARFWTEWVDQLRRDFVKGELKPAVTFVGGARDIYYGNDWWSLAPGEAMIVEFEPPDARYWQMQLCDVWFRTMDYATRQSGLNHQQARLDKDGKARIVIAHRDPGVQNWLDTGGHPEGMLQYRWVFTKTNPHPTVKIVPFDQIRAVLPAETPAYPADQRRRSLAIRHRHLARREPVT
jgi:Protein of unknown function (DUF1254)/Protein of unknown function (DUF1214)